MDAVIDFTNAVESACVSLRKRIEKLPRPKIPENTFLILSWQDERGSRLGDYQVAYKNMNLLEKWLHAFNILKANSSLIANSFHEEGYSFHYWVYPEKYDDRIFRKKLGEAKP